MGKVMKAIDDFLRAMRGENKGGKWGVIVFLIAVMIVLGFVLGTCQKADAATVTLAWDAPTTNEDGTPLTDLAGYNIYYGTQPGIYGPPVNVGNVTQTDISLGPVEDVTYHFVATAFDQNGNESGYSNEVTTNIDTVPPMIPGMLRIIP